MNKGVRRSSEESPAPSKHMHFKKMLAVIPTCSGETLRGQCPVLIRCPCGIGNVQLTLLLLSSILCFFGFNIATFGQTNNEEAYRRAITNGDSDLQESYNKAKDADTKNKEATAIAKKACPAKNDPLENGAKQLNEEAKNLTEEANAFARKALREYRCAETLKPGRPEPIFGEGLALLQLKAYCSAIKKIESARKANYRTPETIFALGRALVDSSDVGSKEFQAGINYLTEFIEQAPSGDKNRLIAERLRAKAQEQPGELKEKNKWKDKEPNFASCPMPIPGKTELPFTVSISSAIGYNDNVITLGRGLPLPPATAQKDSLYNESSFTLGRDFSLSHPSSLSHTGWLSDKISLKYVFTADTFEEFPRNDRLLQTVFGSYQRAFTPKLAGLLKISDQWLYIDQNISSNVFSAQEALVLTPNARWKTLVSYYLIRTDGFIFTPPANNPDGFTHRAELVQAFVLIQDRNDLSAVLTLTGQYGHEWNQPSGIAGRFERDDFLGKLEWRVFHAQGRCSFVRGVTIAVSDRWQPDRYTHATFPSSTTNGLFARSDQNNVVAFAMSIPMWYDSCMANAGLSDANRLEAVFDYRHTTRDSNVQSKAYDQNIFLVTLKLNF